MSSSCECFNSITDCMILSLIEKGGRFVQVVDEVDWVQFTFMKNPDFEVVSHSIIFDRYKRLRNNYGVVMDWKETRETIVVILVRDEEYSCWDEVDQEVDRDDDDCTSEYGSFPDFGLLPDSLQELDKLMGGQNCNESNIDNCNESDYSKYGNYPNNGDCRPLNLTDAEKVELKNQLDRELDQYYGRC